MPQKYKPTKSSELSKPRKLDPQKLLTLRYAAKCLSNFMCVYFKCNYKITIVLNMQGSSEQLVTTMEALRGAGVGYHEKLLISTPLWRILVGGVAIGIFK